MKRLLAVALRRLARWLDPPVWTLRTGPILQEDVDDIYGGIVPVRRWVIK